MQKEVKVNCFRTQPMMTLVHHKISNHRDSARAQHTHNIKLASADLHIAKPHATSSHINHTHCPNTNIASAALHTAQPHALISHTNWELLSQAPHLAILVILLHDLILLCQQVLGNLVQQLRTLLGGQVLQRPGGSSRSDCHVPGSSVLHLHGLVGVCRLLFLGLQPFLLDLLGGLLAEEGAHLVTWGQASNFDVEENKIKDCAFRRKNILKSHVLNRAVPRYVM